MLHDERDAELIGESLENLGVSDANFWEIIKTDQFSRMYSTILVENEISKISSLLNEVAKVAYYSTMTFRMGTSIRKPRGFSIYLRAIDLTFLNRSRPHCRKSWISSSSVAALSNTIRDVEAKVGRPGMFPFSLSQSQFVFWDSSVYSRNFLLSIFNYCEQVTVYGDRYKSVSGPSKATKSFITRERNKLTMVEWHQNEARPSVSKEDNLRLTRALDMLGSVNNSRVY